MTQPRLTDRATADLEEAHDLNKVAWHILASVVMKWETDPMSVHCFDLRMVALAKEIVARRKELDKKPCWPAVFD